MTKLYRSQRDKKIFGLCGGLAEAFNVDPTLLRLIVVITAFFSGGTTVLLYIIASIVIPKEPGSFSGHHNPYNSYYGSHSSSHNGTYTGSTTSGSSRTEPAQPNIDEMMKDIEKKAMKNEIEQLRAKLAKYEKGEE